MADVNKSINISVKADMKDALNNIKKLPNVTAKEASEMRKILKKEFKSAEKAAKQAEIAQTRAMKRTAQEAKKASIQMRALKKESAQMGGALVATGDLVGEFNPALGAMASTAGIAGMAIRDLGKVFLTGNPYILGAVVAIGGAIAVYSHFTAEAEKLDNAQKDVFNSIQNANTAIQQQQESALNASQALSDQRAQVEDLEFQYKLLTGQVTQLDADMRKAEATAEKARSKLAEAGAEQDKANEKAIKAQERLIESHKRNLKVLEDAGQKQDENGKKTDGYLHRQNNLIKAEEKLVQLQNHREESLDKFITQSAEESIALEDVLKKTAEARDADRKRREAQRRQSKQASADAKEQAQLMKEKAQVEKEQAKRDQENLKTMQTMLDTGDKAKQSSQQIELQNKRMLISMIDDEMTKLIEIQKLDENSIQNKIDLAEKQKVLNLESASTVEQEMIAKLANRDIDLEIQQLKEQQHILEMKQGDERLKLLEDEKKKRLELGFQIAGYYTSLAQASSTLIKTVSKENQKSALIAFRISQAGAIADIAMTTASKVMQVAPVVPAMVAVGALGAVQTATVLAQSPPEMHMGGFIGKGEDTRNITVLTGEAVLDRRTVERLGGEEGINQIQRGQSPTTPQIIVTNPFKHFDRYARASMQRGGSLAMLNSNSGAGSY